MSWVCDQHRFVFFHVPRTAGTSMILSLQKAGIDLLRWPPGKVGHVQDHSIETPKRAEKYLKVAGVRNPFNRELSFYLWYRRTGKAHQPIPTAARAYSYENYLTYRFAFQDNDAYLRRLNGLQSDFLRGISVQVLLRYEELPTQWRQFTQEHCGKPIPLLRFTDNMNRPYRLRDYYTRRAVAILRHEAGEDFERFGYPSVLPNE